MKSLCCLLIISVFYVNLKEVQSAGCSFSDGANFIAQWAVDRSLNRVNIYVQYQGFPANVDAWTGIAFGDAMYSGLDAAIIKVLGGRVVVSDEYVQGYGPSWPDKSQDIEVSQAQIVNGILDVRFSKPIHAISLEDHTIDGCTTWQFITGPGRASFNHVSKHSRHPIGQTVCLQQC